MRSPILPHQILSLDYTHSFGAKPNGMDGGQVAAERMPHELATSGGIPDGEYCLAVERSWIGRIQPLAISRDAEERRVTGVAELGGADARDQTGGREEHVGDQAGHNECDDEHQRPRVES